MPFKYWFYPIRLSRMGSTKGYRGKWNSATFCGRIKEKTPNKKDVRETGNIDNQTFFTFF